MPQNIALAAFIFGGVLLLLAVSSGSFKVFGAEMSGAVGRGPRIASGVIGVLLLCFGAWQANRPDPSSRPEPSPNVVAGRGGPAGGQAGSGTPTPAPAPTATTTQPDGAVAFGPTALPVGKLSDAEDSVQILDISPPPGSHLTRGSPQVFNIKVMYSLQSADTGILSISVAQIRDSALQCAGRSGQLTDATQVQIERGVHTTEVALTWSGDSIAATKGNVDMKGYLRFVPMFWRTGRRDRIRVFEGYDRLCMRFD
jgi:hypothetical protein